MPMVQWKLEWREAVQERCRLLSVRHWHVLLHQQPLRRYLYVTTNCIAANIFISIYFHINFFYFWYHRPRVWHFMCVSFFILLLGVLNCFAHVLYVRFFSFSFPCAFVTFWTRLRSESATSAKASKQLNRKWSGIRNLIRVSAGSLPKCCGFIVCRRQSFRRVSWKTAGDCMRNANKSP